MENSSYIFKDSFCGSQDFLPFESQHISECFVNFLLILPNGVFLLALLPNIFIRWFKTRSPCDATSRKPGVIYPCHRIRWIITILVIVQHIMMVGEGFLSAKLAWDWSFHQYFPFIIATIVSVLTLAVYTFAEEYRIPGLMSALLLYWMSMCLIGLLKISILMRYHLELNAVRFWLSWTLTTTYAFLAIIDIYILLDMRYACCKPSSQTDDPITVVESTSSNPPTSFLSRITWCWLNATMLKGRVEALVHGDLVQIAGMKPTRRVQHEFEAAFYHEQTVANSKKRQPTLWRVFWARLWKGVVLAGLFKLFADLLIFIPPIAIDWIVQYIVQNTTKDEPVISGVTAHVYFSNGYIIGMLMMMAIIFQSLLWQNHFHLSIQQGVTCKAALQALVHDKCLRLPIPHLHPMQGSLSAEQVLSHLVSDTENILWFFYFGHFLWSMPMQVLVCVLLLYHQMGVSAVTSAAIVLILCPLQILIAQGLDKVQAQVTASGTERTRRLCDLLHHLHLLKLYGWEVLQHLRVLKARDVQFEYLTKAACFRVISAIFVDVSPLLAILLTFILYPHFEPGQTLDAGKVFSTVALFNILLVPVTVFPTVINVTISAFESTKRICDYLLQEDIRGTRKRIPTTKVNRRLSYHNSQSEINQKSFTAKNVSMPYADDTEMHSNSEIEILIQDGYFVWNEIAKRPILSNIQLKVPQGRLTLIVGEPGSGKTALVSAILGEMKQTAGSIQWKRDQAVAYCPQQPWVLEANVKDNILFGDFFQKDRYNDVVHACGIDRDISALPRGEHTSLGPPGASLPRQPRGTGAASLGRQSLGGRGGLPVQHTAIQLRVDQIQRLALARAAYSSTNVVLLDEPMSALEMKTAARLFKDTILLRMLKANRTIIMATNQLHYLPYAHKVVVMKDGKILQQGSLSEIKKSNPEIYKEWKSVLGSKRSRSHNASLAEADQTSVSPTKLSITPFKRPMLSPTTSTPIDPPSYRPYLRGPERPLQSSPPLSLPPLIPAKSMVSLAGISVISEEEQPLQPELERERALLTGDTSSLLPPALDVSIEQKTDCTAYRNYIWQASFCLIAFMIISYIIRQILAVYYAFWLSKWSRIDNWAADNDTFLVHDSNDSGYLNTSHDQLQLYDYWDYLDVFLVVFGATAGAGLIAVSSVEYTCLRTAVKIHDEVLKVLVTAHPRNFDSAEGEKIANKFGSDTSVLEEKLPQTLDCVMYNLLFLSGALALNICVTPYFLIPTVLLILVYFYVLRFYIPTSRQLQRLETSTKTRLIDQFTETILGLPTIRAYRQPQFFQRRSERALDEHTTSTLNLHAASVWMGLRMDTVGAGLVFSAVVCGISTCSSGTATPALALALAYAIMVSGSLNWLTRFMSEAQIHFQSVDRLSALKEIPTETYINKQDIRPRHLWPSRAEINFEKVSVRYSSRVPPIVTDFTLDISDGEKIGFLGNATSGNREIAMSIFRLLDVFSGNILINGIDVLRVPLHTVRTKIAVLPKDVAVVDGSVRHNLDPNNGELKQKDSDIWKVLEMVQLKDKIRSLSGKLDADIARYRDSFSRTQIMQLSVARILLKPSRLLVIEDYDAYMDDPQLYTILRHALKTAFHHATIIMVSETASHLVDCHSVIVMEDGDIVEAGMPPDLLNRNSRFAAMMALT